MASLLCLLLLRELPCDRDSIILKNQFCDTWAVLRGAREVLVVRTAETPLRRDQVDLPHPDAYPRLTLSCEDNRLRASVAHWLYEGGKVRRFAVAMKFDDDGPLDVQAVGSSWIAFLKEPKQFVKMALGHERLVFHLKAQGLIGQEIHFKLDGLSEAMVPLYQACGEDPVETYPGKPRENQR
jgi:hypothetical protein